MSFSFGGKAANKEAAKAAIAEKLAEVARTQTVHSLDVPTIQKAADAHIDLLGDPAENQEVSYSINGSIWADMPTAGPTRIQSVNMGVSVGLAIKEAQAA